MAEQRISGGRFTWGTVETLSDDLTCDMRPGSSHQHSTFDTFNIQEESLKTTQTWAIIYHVSLRIALATYSYTNALLTDAADAESPLKPAELQVLRHQYEKEGEYVSLQTKFNFAWGLIKSTQRPEQQEGVRLLTEIFRSSPDRRRECLYYLALGNYKLGSYAEARRYNELLVDLEPNNLQAQSLRQLIDDKVAKEGLMGVAIVGGLAVAAGVVGGLIFKGARGSRR
ncbi:mitochondria fission 1 protein [Aureobasidium pullulans]|nr:mitochondria fission 1 protein [Aureobasidium pullulans]TIA21855.1 mitochondria fission 1 protein [Aureobasidium pullulans]